MKVLDYIDQEGRKRRVQLPNDAPDSDAPLGVLIGPPDISALGLAPECEVRLHNELWARGLLTESDARARPHDLQGAIQAALKVDTAVLYQCYIAKE